MSCYYRYGLQFQINNNNLHLLLWILLSGDVALNPGPCSTPSYPRPPNVAKPHNMECLYLNARSLTNKTSELRTLVTADIDLIAITETWLKPEIANCELLPEKDFIIHRRDRLDRTCGGTLLAVKNTILSLRREDLESTTEMLVCEIRPESKKKLLSSGICILQTT